MSTSLGDWPKSRVGKTFPITTSMQCQIILVRIKFVREYTWKSVAVAGTLCYPNWFWRRHKPPPIQTQKVSCKSVPMHWKPTKPIPDSFDEAKDSRPASQQITRFLQFQKMAFGCLHWKSNRSKKVNSMRAFTSRFEQAMDFCPPWHGPYYRSTVQCAWYTWRSALFGCWCHSCSGEIYCAFNSGLVASFCWACWKRRCSMRNIKA